MSTHKPDNKRVNNEEKYSSYQLPKTSLKIPMPPVKKYQYTFGEAKGCVGNITGGVVNNWNDDTKLNETVEAIKELIEQLSKNHPINNTSDAMKIATQAIETIETNLTWKQKAIASCQQGLLEGIKTNPVGAFVAGAIEGWTDQESIS